VLPNGVAYGADDVAWAAALLDVMQQEVKADAERERQVVHAARVRSATMETTKPAVSMERTGAAML
jgi:hypothetical protein